MSTKGASLAPCRTGSKGPSAHPLILPPTAGQALKESARE